MSNSGRVQRVKNKKSITIMLSDLLGAHERFANRSTLPENFGDGYLYHFNPIYRNIRDSFFALGGKFTRDDFCGYRTLRLAALSEITRRNLVFYEDNVSAYRAVEKRRPNSFSENFTPFSQSNNLLHESAHCIAHAILKKVKLPTDEIAREQYRVLCIVMEEAFANTCEAMASFFITNDIHRTLYIYNSYIKPRSFKLGAEFSRASRSEIFSFLLLSYMFSNFLYADIKRSGVRLFLKLCMPGRAFSSKDEERYHQLARWAFQLDLSFRVSTASFYYRLLGFKRNVHELLDFNFIALLYKNANLESALQTLASIGAEGIESEYLKSASNIELKRAA